MSRPKANQVSPIDLKLRFTQAERIAIAREAYGHNGAAIDFLDIINDHRLISVELEGDWVRDSLASFVRKGVVSQARATEILGGSPR